MGRPVSQPVRQFRYIANRMSYLAGPEVAVNRIVNRYFEALILEMPFDQPVKRQYRYLFPAADVENLSETFAGIG